MLPLPDVFRAQSPINGASSTQNDKRNFLADSVRSKYLARLQPPDKKTHVVPASLLPAQMEKFATLLGWQIRGMEEETAVAQVSPDHLWS